MKKTENPAASRPRGFVKFLTFYFWRVTRHLTAWSP